MTTSGYIFPEHSLTEPMTRDLFAAVALHALITRPRLHLTTVGVADQAYAYADAMMRIRGLEAPR